MKFQRKDKTLENKLLSELDCGSKQTFMDKLCKKASPDNSGPNELLETWLPFAQKHRYKEKILKLTLIIPRLKKLPQSSVDSAMISWIHYTNKIEYQGMDNLKNTEEAVREYLNFQNVSHVSDIENQGQKKAVWNTLKLLKTTYDPKILGNNDPVQLISFDIVKLRMFHSILFANLVPIRGSFRTTGAYTKLPDQTEFKYPHHELIPTALETLGHVTYRLIKHFISELDQSDEIRTIGFCFAMAAFVQFHLVSIHPFEDGNGRISRFLSKRILDWVLPFPFPMFENREVYMNALINGRFKEDIAFSPESLMDVLLDAALEYYESLFPKIEITYSYRTIEENEIDLTDYNFTVKISRIDNNIARLYFIDKEKNPIPVPENVSIFETGENLAQQQFQDSFFITWIGNYSLKDKDIELIRLTNQKQHAITGEKIVEIRNSVN